MRTIFLLSAGLFLSFYAYSQTLVAYYPFNGNPNDQSGYGRNPTYVGASPTTDRFGKANSAYEFSGATSGHIEYTASGLPATNRTISLWFYTLDVSNRPGLFGYGGNGSCGTTLFMSINLSGSGQYNVQGHCGNNAAGFSYAAAPVNSWYHWVLTINGSTQKIYINGELKSTDNTFSGSTATGGGAELSFGVIPYTDGQAPYTDANVGYLNGKMDDIRIYDAAMSDAQVLQLYNNESTGLVAYYPFNGNSNDESGNSINPTYIGTGVTLTADRFGNANKAYYFDGAAGSYIRIPADNFPATDRTISFWFNADDPAVSRTPFSYGGSGCNGSCFLVELNKQGDGAYRKEGHCSSERIIVPYAVPPVKSWKHWVITINGTVQKIYIDGVLQTPSLNEGFSTPTYVSGRNVLFGSMIHTDGINEYAGWAFKGKLDEFRIYNIPLSDAQILQLYKNESTGMVAYYPFNSNANDESGNGHDGTVTEAAPTTDRNGTTGKAYLFDGVNDRISVPDHPDWDFGNGDFSIASWVNVNVFGTSRIVSAGYDANDGIWGLGFGQQPVWGSGTRINFFVLNGGSYRDFSSDEITGYVAGQWGHVGIIKKGTTLDFYYNGKLAGTTTLPYLANANSFLSIGCRQNSPGNLIEFFNGKIDELRIYKRAISPNEMARLADVPLLPDLLAYYPMNGNANDMSGYNRNGTPYGVALLTTDKYDHANSAYSFDGVASGITLANTGSLDFVSTPFAISAWVKYSNITGNPVSIVSKHTCGSANGYILGVQNNAFNFWMANGGAWGIVQTSELYNDNKWHHVVGSYDGSNQALYVDGMLKSAGPVVYNNPSSAASIKIGDVTNTCSGGIFSGSIDEVKIYGAALDAVQVTSLYKQSRGSGNALLFKGNSANHVLLPGMLEAPPAFFLEAWVKRNAVQQWQWLFSGTETNTWQWGLNDNTMLFGKVNGGGAVVSYAINIDDNRWHHLAVTYNGSTGAVSFFVDGVGEGTGNISNSGIVSGTYSIGNRSGTTQSFDGYIDEFRIGDGTRDINAVRNWMCRKPTTDGYSGLGFYYNFDEPTINTAYDCKGGSKALLIDGPQYVASGAPLGDICALDFTGTFKTAAITIRPFEIFTATETTGAMFGLTVYVVKDPPANQTGILGLGNNDCYAGVYVSYGTNPQYTATYDYTGNPYVSPAVEPTLQLFKRNDNSASPWINSGATLNTTTNTLTVTGQNTEYILGSSGFGLPVTTLNLQASKLNSTTARLYWQTTSEINNKGFEVQRSFDGNYYTALQFVNGAGNTHDTRDYTITDIPGRTGRVFYRLKQIDLDGISKLSNIVSMLFDKQGIIKLYPNPAQRQVTVEGIENFNKLQVISATGKLMREVYTNGQYQVNMNLEGFKGGIYLLRMINEKESQTVKLVISN